MDFLNNWEIGILDLIREHLSCAFLDRVMPVITSLADEGILWIIAAVVMLLFRKTRKTGITVGVALILGLVFGNGIMKPLIGRTRPYDVNADVTLLVERLSDGSFPSGHTLASFEAAGAMLLCDRRFGYPALAVAVLIAFSRLYLYVHYPTDILGGIVFGLLFAFISYLIVKMLYRKFGWDGKKDCLDVEA